MSSLEQQPDEVLLRFHGASFEHADLDDRILFGGAVQKVKVGPFHWKEAVGTLAGGEIQGLHDAGMNDIRKLRFNGV